jgi:hypothetical protein
MRLVAIAMLIIVAATFAIAEEGKTDAFEVKRDLSRRDPAEFYDFNVDLLTHLGKPIKLDLQVAAKDLDRKTGWLLSSYYITPDELRGIELQVPQSAISDDGKGRLNVRGTFKLSEAMDRRQGEASLHLLPAE